MLFEGSTPNLGHPPPSHLLDTSHWGVSSDQTTKASSLQQNPQHPAGAVRAHHNPASVCRHPHRVLSTPCHQAEPPCTDQGGRQQDHPSPAQGVKGHNKFISKCFPPWIPLPHPDRGHFLHLSHAQHSNHVQTHYQSASWSASFTSPLSKICAKKRHSLLGSPLVSLEDKAGDLWAVQLRGTPWHLYRWQLHSWLSQGIQNDKYKCTYFYYDSIFQQKWSQILFQTTKKSQVHKSYQQFNVYSRLTFYWTKWPREQTSFSSAVGKVLGWSVMPAEDSTLPAPLGHTSALSRWQDRNFNLEFPEFKAFNSNIHEEWNTQYNNKDVLAVLVCLRV